MQRDPRVGPAEPRRIVGYHTDEEGHWVADLECGHGQHVRHDPPWQVREWVTTPEGRESRLGHALECVKCVQQRTERERMVGGAWYDSRDPELLAMAHRARALLARYHAIPSTDGDARHALLAELLGAVGEGVWIEPPFFCDYGAQIEVGAHTFVNANCTLLDSAPIRIGANVLVGPGVQLLTATHPLRAAERLPAEWDPAGGTARYRTRAAPIVIGDDCWLGAGTIVMPGVTIGAGTTIGAGSLVTAHVPAGVLAFGQPCRVQRAL